MFSAKSEQRIFETCITLAAEKNFAGGFKCSHCGKKISKFFICETVFANAKSAQAKVFLIQDTASEKLLPFG